MKRIVAKATIVTSMSVIASVVMASIIVPGANGIVDGNGLLMATFCPMVIAWPASAYTFWQKERLREALESAQLAHLQLAEAHRILGEKARRDHMTGLLNREAFLSKLDDGRVKGGTLLIVDADNFKQINDNFGHMTGDAALLQIVAAIRRGVREGDLVGRIGGEEFGIFLHGADDGESAVIAERIRTEVAAVRFAPSPGSDHIALSVSIGGAASHAATRLADLLQAADRRLYEAKRTGRNRVVFAGLAAAA